MGSTAPTAEFATASSITSGILGLEQAVTACSDLESARLLYVDARSLSREYFEFCMSADDTSETPDKDLGQRLHDTIAKVPAKIRAVTDSNQRLIEDLANQAERSLLRFVAAANTGGADALSALLTQEKSNQPPFNVTIQDHQP